MKKEEEEFMQKNFMKSQLNNNDSKLQAFLNDMKSMNLHN